MSQKKMQHLNVVASRCFSDCFYHSRTASQLIFLMHWSVCWVIIHIFPNKIECASLVKVEAPWKMPPPSISLFITLLLLFGYFTFLWTLLLYWHEWTLHLYHQVNSRLNCPLDHNDKKNWHKKDCGGGLITDVFIS